MEPSKWKDFGRRGAEGEDRGATELWGDNNRNSTVIGYKQTSPISEIAAAFGMVMKTPSTIHRQIFTIREPMIMWSIDSWDKLAYFKLWVHAGIDAGTSYVVYAVITNNKCNETLFSAYMGVVEKWGRPLHIRINIASEHCLIREDLEAYRAMMRRLFIMGRSVHNQHIEVWWRQMREEWADVL